MINLSLIAIFIDYNNCVITKCAETGFAPPANGVIVNAVLFPVGFLTSRIVFITDVVIIEIPKI